MKILPNKFYLTFFWFLPIVIATSRRKFFNAGIENYIVYFQSIILLVGLFYILSTKKFVIQKSILFIAFIFLINILISDFSEYKFVFFILSYLIIVHILTRRYPSEVWSQYYFISIIVCFLAFIDLIWFFLVGEFLISYRVPEVLNFGFPRINSLFDEMSHMAFFIMPATIFAFVNNDRYKYILAIAIALSFSVAAIIAFAFLLMIYYRKYFLYNPLKLINIFLLFAGFLITYVAGELIIGKLANIFFYDNLINLELKKQVSSANILLSIEVIKNIELYELLFGFGYFNYQEGVTKLIQSSELINYFNLIGLGDDPQGIGIFNFIIQFGLIQTIIIIFLIIIIKKNAKDPWLYKLSLLIVFLSMTKNSHTISYLVHLFFLFGLPWANTEEHKKKISNKDVISS